MGKLNDKFLRRTEDFMKNKNLPPKVSGSMYKGVSEERRGLLADEVERGLFRDGNAISTSKDGLTSASFVTSSVGFKKNAQVLTSQSPGSQWRGGNGEAVRQTPEVYSPLWLNSNLNLPRDRATINAWCRSFYALAPFVQNAINLHSTYPISKLNIKCPNKKVEKFFNNMIEELDLMNVCAQVAQEFWLLGETFIYAELDERNAKWSRLIIQNPDYIVVKRSVIANEPLIMLRPDENLRRIVFSNKPSDIEQKKQLNETIVEHIKRGENIPLDNFYVSHLARRISPYEVRGTGLPVCCFRQLMLFDKLRECYSDDSEVLTDQGFKKISDLVQQTTSINPNPNYVNGVELDENGKITSTLTMKEDFKVACINPETNEIEYHKPIELHMSQYNGEMIHFESRNVDTLVTPNHKMWAQKKNRIDGASGWTEWSQIKASDINPGTTYRFRGIVDWNGNTQESIEVLSKNIPIKLYLKFIGYVIAEGYLGQNCIDLVQKIDSDCIDDIKYTTRAFGDFFNKKICEREIETKDYKKAGFKKQPSNRWNGRINSKELMNYFITEICSNDGKSTAEFKKIPMWIKSLNKDLLSILLDTLVLGDGSNIKNKSSDAFKYYTVSKQLADDVQEIAFKCGYAPSIYSRKLPSEKTEYCVSWSNAADGNFPIITPNNKYPDKIKKVNYNGIVWCFEVPTGLFITRRNGKISIHGNSKFAQSDNMINPLTLVKIGSADYKPTFADLESWRNVFEEAQYDKDFKIFTHEGVAVERVGYNQGIFDISGDITQLLKEIYTGLMVPQVLMDGGGDITYANGGISLDVLRQRYMQFRNMMSAWLRKKIFAPISKLNEFYEYEDGEKKLIIPEIDWNHMSLFDTSDYVNVLVQLSGEQKKVSQQTLYRSLGLEYEEERRKIKKEDISDAIRKKELVSLDRMALNELRALSDEDEIPEITEPALPGQSPYSDPLAQPGGPGGLPPLPGMPGGDLGLPPPPPGGGLGGGLPPGGGSPPPSSPPPI